jgi:uncharacterized protein YuzE
MNYTYDAEADALYVSVTAAPIHGQVERADGVIVDVDDAGQAVGFDVMNPDAGWDADGLARDYRLPNADEMMLLALRRVRSWRQDGPVVHPAVSPGGVLQDVRAVRSAG